MKLLALGRRVDTPHPGCFAKRVRIRLIAKDLTSLERPKSPQQYKTKGFATESPRHRVRREIGGLYPHTPITINFTPREERRKLAGRTKMNHLPSHAGTSLAEGEFTGSKGGPGRRRVPPVRTTWMRTAHRAQQGRSFCVKSFRRRRGGRQELDGAGESPRGQNPHPETRRDAAPNHCTSRPPAWCLKLALNANRINGPAPGCLRKFALVKHNQL